LYEKVTGSPHPSGNSQGHLTSCKSKLTLTRGLAAAAAAAAAGRISEQEVVTQFLALLGAGISTSVLLDKWAGHEFLLMLLTSCNS
jgi:hypothetical protein